MSKIQCLLLTMLLILLFAQTSQAASRVYSAHACKAKSYRDAGAIEFNSNAVKNVSSNTATVICPVPAYSTINTHGMRAWVRVKNATSTSSLSCKLVSASGWGIRKDYVTRYTNSTTPKSLALYVNQSDRKSVYTIECRLPPNSKVFSYKVTEYNY